MADIREQAQAEVARFGRRLKEVRQGRGWSQGELAKRITDAGFPMHQSAVSKIEAATRATPVDEVFVLAVVLGVEIPELFGEEAQRNAAEIQVLRAHVRGKLATLETRTERARAALDEAMATQRKTSTEALELIDALQKKLDN